MKTNRILLLHIQGNEAESPQARSEMGASLYFQN